jgi:hypothetical protein
MSGASTLVEVVQSAEEVGDGVPELDGDGLQLGEALGEPPPMIDATGPGRPPEDELGDGLADADADADAEPLGDGELLAEAVADGLAVALAEAEAVAVAEGEAEPAGEELLLGEPDGQLSAAMAPVPDAAVTRSVVAPVTTAMTPATNSPPDVRARMQCSFVSSAFGQAPSAGTGRHTRTAVVQALTRFSRLKRPLATACDEAHPQVLARALATASTLA